LGQVCPYLLLIQSEGKGEEKRGTYYRGSKETGGLRVIVAGMRNIQLKSKKLRGIGRWNLQKIDQVCRGPFTSRKDKCEKITAISSLRRERSGADLSTKWGEKGVPGNPK